VCGLVAGRDGQAEQVHPGRNVSPTPLVAYELDIATLAKQIEFEEDGLALAAVYHSHPRGPETPSATDVRLAHYPDAVYLICSLADPAAPVLRGFRIVTGDVSEVIPG
jgi:proteasome lid subunit RPN8/RPN11